MSFFFLICSVFAVLLTTFALAGGLISMVKGAEFREKYANKLMKLRVISQGAAIILLYVAFTLSN